MEKGEICRVGFICTYKLAQAALRAPAEVAFAMRSWPLLLPLFSLFFLLRLLLLTHFGETPEAENLFPQIFWNNYKEYLKKNLGNF